MGGILGGGKDGGSAPQAPDYRGAAQETAQGNLQAARVNAMANRVNQYTPYGNLIYSQVPGGFNQSAYDQAMKTYNDQLGSYYSNYNQAVANGSPVNGLAPPQAPNRSDFNTGNPDQWQANISLSPVGQQLLDYQNQAALGLGQQTSQALGRVDQSLSSPFDYQSIKDVSDDTYAAQTARLDPQWNQRQQQTETQLINQGLRPGTEAYDNAMRDFNQGRNDAYTQARVSAYNMMPQAFQLQSSIRNQPLNELNALRTGSQVTNPNFMSVPQQAMTQGPDYLGAASNQYNAAMGQYNAQQASDSNFMGGLLGLAGQLGGSYLLGGGAKKLFGG